MTNLDFIGIGQYERIFVTTASREQLVLLLYEGAIRFIRRARDAMAVGNRAGKGRYISKATNILTELIATLDHKVGGELAEDLENLYVYLIDKLIEGNIKESPMCLEEVEQVLTILLDGWSGIVKKP